MIGEGPAAGYALLLIPGRSLRSHRAELLYVTGSPLYVVAIATVAVLVVGS